jgi:hypothetical protein
VDAFVEYFGREDCPDKQVMALKSGTTESHQETSQAKEQKQIDQLESQSISHIGVEISDESQRVENWSDIDMEKHQEAVKWRQVEGDSSKSSCDVDAGNCVGISQEEKCRPAMQKIQEGNLKIRISDKAEQKKLNFLIFNPKITRKIGKR